MDTRLLRYYERELQHLREMGGEFARDFPKVAARLGLETYSCADPYVERLLEGFSFLAARVQLKIDAEFPRFIEQMFERVYPHYLAPTPSMAIVQFSPDLSEGSLATGFKIPRGSSLRSVLGRDEQTSCEFRTAHEVTLWPVELGGATYLPYTGKIEGIDASQMGPVASALTLTLNATAGLMFCETELDRLCVHVRASQSAPGRIQELLFANVAGVIVHARSGGAAWQISLPATSIRAVGFDDSDALLPQSPRSFQGYRLLQEYFAFPERFRFFELTGLSEAVRRCAGVELSITILLDHFDSSLEKALSADNFSLYCTPVINLFPKRADRIHLSESQLEYHLLADRTRPTDFEVYQVLDVKGFGTGNNIEQTFRPFFAADDLSTDQPGAYFQTRRTRRLLSERERREGHRSGYLGTEIFMSLVDVADAPYRSSLRQLGCDTLCTNRDLPLTMTLGGPKTDFTLAISAPVQSVRCLSGPTAPVPSHVEGEIAWRMISHLSLNYLSLVDHNNNQGAVALRDLLTLYCPPGQNAVRTQVEGVLSIVAKPIVRRLPSPGPITYGRGVQLVMTVDDAAFEGVGPFLLASVLDRFFAKYTTMNSFTETVLRSVARGEIMKWPARSGTCEVL